MTGMDQDSVDLRALLGDVAINGRGESVPLQQLNDCVVGLYFSAHWCPPCRAFTPKLAEVYKNVKAAGKKFEILFITSDRSEKDFEEYHATMPWLALAFTKRQERAAASQRFGIQGIPALVLLEGGKVINRNARGAVLQDHPMGTGFPWAGQEDAAPGGDGGLRSWLLMAALIALYFLLRYYFKVI